MLGGQLKWKASEVSCLARFFYVYKKLGHHGALQWGPGRHENRVHFYNLNVYNHAVVTKTLIESVIALPIAERLELLDRLRESLRNDPALAPLSDEEAAHPRQATR
jgi:hypothetical protein